MYLILISASLVALVYGTVPFTWSDCSPDKATQAIQVTSITASPVPLVAPGPLHLSFSAKVLKPVSVFLLDFEMERHAILGSKIHVPCFSGIGSCVSDGCTFVSSLQNSTRPSAQSIAKQVLEMVSSVNASLSCPIPVENIDVNHYTINVPDLGAVANVFADGDYTVTVRTKVPATGEVLGCLTMEISLTNKCTGWLCPKRRRFNQKYEN